LLALVMPDTFPGLKRYSGPSSLAIIVTAARPTGRGTSVRLGAA
jgi:hypothetical protein